MLTDRDEKMSLDDIKSPYIKKAIEYNSSYVEMLTIRDFIRITGYPIDSFMIDSFFLNLRDDIPIYITKELIEWCGFSGDDKTMKRRFYEALESYKENEDYWIYSNKEYEEYYNNSMHSQPNIETSPETKVEYDNSSYPAPEEFKGRNKTKHIITTVDCFKDIIMSITTKKAKMIKKYYIALEKLVKLYIQYQVLYKTHKITLLLKANDELHKKVDNLTNMLTGMQEEMSTQTNTLNTMVTKLDNIPKTSSTSTRGRFLLIKLNKVVSPWDYYVIRAQKVAAKRAYKDIHEKFPNAKIELRIDYQPNAVNLFNLVKEELRTRRRVIKVVGNYIQLCENYTNEVFVEDIKKINDDKKQV
jgi:phage anti-repressor protein